MKPQNIAVAAIAVLIAVGVSWWLVMPTASSSKPAAISLAPLNSPANPSPTTPASPSAAPTPPSGVAASPAPTANTPAFPDEIRRELPTLIGDMARRLDTGDLAGFIAISATPDQLQIALKQKNLTLEQFAQNAILQPGFPEQMKNTSATLHSIQFAKPDMNPTGDLATYVLSPPPANGPKVLIFKKVNGLWYVQN